MIYAQVKIQPLPGSKYKLLEDFTFEDVTVPCGYITNGADIPRVFWVILPPNKSDFMPAVILHDYLCDKEEYKKADDLFDRCLRELKVINRERVILVGSVRLYHRVRYPSQY